MKLQQKFVQTSAETQHDTQTQIQTQLQDNFLVNGEDNSLFDFQGLKFTKGVSKQLSQQQESNGDQNILAQSQELEQKVIKDDVKKRSQTASSNHLTKPKPQFFNKRKQRLLQSATTKKLKIDLDKLDFKQNTQDNSQSVKSLKTTKLTHQKIQKIQELSQQILKIEKTRTNRLSFQQEKRQKSSESDYTRINRHSSKSEFLPLRQINIYETNLEQKKKEKKPLQILQKVREYSPQLRNKKLLKQETNSNDSVLNITDTMFNRNINNQFQNQKEEKLPAILDYSFQKSNRDQLYRSQAFSSCSQNQTGQKSPKIETEIKKQPIIDQSGNIAYDAKFRKPKWANEKEIKLRFSDEPEETLEHLANSRIRIEDPFTRQPNSNTVFDHIQDHEIAKFIVGTQYLSRCNMNQTAQIVMEPNLVNLELFFDEKQYPILLRNKRTSSVNSKSSQFANKWAKKLIQKDFLNTELELQIKRNDLYKDQETQMENFYKYPLVNNWQINLKANKYFLKQPKYCPSDKKFQQYFKQNKQTLINKQSIKKSKRQLSPDGGLFDQEQLERFKENENQNSWLIGEDDERQVDLDQEDLDTLQKLKQNLVIDTGDEKQTNNNNQFVPQSPSKFPKSTQTRNLKDLNAQLQPRLRQNTANSQAGNIFSPKRQEASVSPQQNITTQMSPLNLKSPTSSQNLSQIEEFSFQKVSLLGMNALNNQVADLDEVKFLGKAFDQTTLDQVLKRMVVWSHNFRPSKEERIQTYLQTEPDQVNQIYSELKTVKDLQYLNNEAQQNTIQEDKLWPLKQDFLKKAYFDYFKYVSSVENAQRYSYLFEKLEKTQEQLNRNLIQLRIISEFERLEKILREYQLLYDSSFQPASYQIDFTDRMIFQTAVVNALAILTPQIKNDDVFKAKYRNWMLQKIFDRNIKILEDPLVDQFWHHSRPIPELWDLIRTENFNFEQQSQLYRQWYTNWIFFKAIKNNGEDIGGGFNNVKQMYETIDTRQQESVEGKKQRLHPRHTSWSELQRFIYQGKWTNILDENSNLIKNVQEFKVRQNFILQKFQYKKANFDKKMKLGNDKLKISHLFFFYTLEIDDEKPSLINQLIQYDNEDYQNPIELRFNDVVFRARLANTENQQIHKNKYLPPFEYFEVIYPICYEFFDKKQLHPVLNHQLKLRYLSQQKEIIRIINFRKEILNFKIESWKKQNNLAYQNYIKNEKKLFKLIRSRSTDSFPSKYQMPYENRDKLELLIYQIENRRIPQPYHQIIQPEEVLTENQIMAAEGGRAVISSDFEFSEKSKNIIEEQDEQDEQDDPIEIDYSDVNPFDDNLIFFKLKAYGELQCIDEPQQLKNKLELVYRYKKQFKKLSKPYTKHLEVNFDFLVQRYKKKLEDAELNFLKLNKPKKQRKQYLFVPLYDQQKEQDRRNQKDCRFLRWLEGCLDNQIYSDFITKEDNTLQMCNENQDFSSKFWIKSKELKKKQQKILKPIFSFEQRQNRKQKLFPEFFGYNIHRQMIQNLVTSKDILTNYKKRFNGKKKAVKINISSQSLILSATEKSSDINKEDLKDRTKPFLQKLHDSSQVTQYADRQLWKQMRDAINEGNIQLLNNYLIVFAKLLKQRPSSLQNYQEPMSGNTLLHIVIQQSYDQDLKQKIICALLKEVQMNTDLKNNNGKTVIELAKEFGFTLSF